MMLYAAIFAVALVVAVQADGNWQNDNNRGGWDNAKLVSQKDIKLPTIVKPTERHYKKRVSSSKSRRDKYAQVNTRTETDLHQKVVTSDEYVKDNVHAEYPLKVLNVNHHNHHLTVKNVYPKHKNLYVNRYKTIIKPQEGRTDSYSNSESRKKVVHPLEVQNRQESVNLGTEVKQTQWVDVGHNNNNGYRQNNNNGGYRNNKNQDNDWADD